MDDVLAGFHPAVSGWFRERFGEPSPPQRLGWPSIAAGKHTLILAPTGSGKTLAAFLWCLNELYEHPAEGVQVLYVSPLKA
ncbi:MAG TPA: DEAD/DEAH box helicase, partial [Chloroflexota bacterium]|nr:DEAD/DEAH box helicase [Chloroflexota bacterium]